VEGTAVFKKINLLVAAFAMGGIGCSTYAQAACWTAQDAEAAHVRDLDTMLMVSALRCRLTGQDIMPTYNAFVRESRPILSASNNRLRSHFGTMDSYDRYVTGVANRYGAGADGLNCRDMAAIVKAARGEQGSPAGLVKVAKSAGVRPSLPGGLCPLTVAQAR
jgi:hypothetical protein